MALFCVLIAGCSANTTSSQQWTGVGSALPLMEHITLNAQSCWFKSRTADFKPYRLAPELHSFSGRPRMLLVPYANPAARPLLVVEASGDPAQISAYGPLMKDKTGKRIARDLERWLTGSTSC